MVKLTLKSFTVNEKYPMPGALTPLLTLEDAKKVLAYLEVNAPRGATLGHKRQFWIVPQHGIPEANIEGGDDGIKAILLPFREVPVSEGLQ